MSTVERLSSLRVYVIIILRHLSREAVLSFIGGSLYLENPSRNHLATQKLTFGTNTVHHALNYVQFMLNGKVDEVGIH